MPGLLWLSLQPAADFHTCENQFCRPTRSRLHDQAALKGGESTRLHGGFEAHERNKVHQSITETQASNSIPAESNQSQGIGLGRLQSISHIPLESRRVEGRPGPKETNRDGRPE